MCASGARWLRRGRRLPGCSRLGPRIVAGTKLPNGVCAWTRSASSGAGSWGPGSPRSARRQVPRWSSWSATPARSRRAARASSGRCRARCPRASSEGDADAARAHLTFADGFDALADRTLVVEAVMEEESVKTDVFRKLDATVLDEDAILATNTSSIPIIKLAMVTAVPSRSSGCTSSTRCPVLKLVEVISSLLTSSETTARVRGFATDQLGKRVISSPDRAGFVVNALLIPYLLRRSGCSSRGSRAPRTSTPGW